MNLHTSLSSRHVNTYHHNNSLLFQFILAEFVEAYEKLQHLSMLCHPQEEGSIGPPSPPNKSYFLQIESILAKLVGSRNFMRLFTWNFNEGILSKLRTYCALFLRNAENDEKEILALQHYADKIWHYCLVALDYLHEQPEASSTIVSAIDKAEASMQRLSKQLVRVILHFGEDENVIFAVLNMKDRLDKLHGTHYVAKILYKMYPKGLHEAQEALSKKYSARGFDNVIPIIAARITELEKASL